MRLCVALVAVLSASLASAEWKVPKNPDPSAILDDARHDTEAKNYEDALAKHLWFFQHALEIDPELRGIRVSFALGRWHDLGKVYPPALSRLKDVREEKRANVLDGKDVRPSFRDFESINEELGQETYTKSTFETLDAKSPEVAKQVYDLAQPALVKAKEYKLCGKYLDPDRQLARARERRLYFQSEAERPRVDKADMLQFADRSFAHAVTTLIALLVVNDRGAEADELAKVARKELDEAAFSKAIDEALTGKVPPPWP